MRKSLVARTVNYPITLLTIGSNEHSVDGGMQPADAPVAVLPLRSPWRVRHRWAFNAQIGHAVQAHRSPAVGCPAFSTGFEAFPG